MRNHLGVPLETAEHPQQPLAGRGFRRAALEPRGQGGGLEVRIVHLRQDPGEPLPDLSIDARLLRKRLDVGRRLGKPAKADEAQGQPGPDVADVGGARLPDPFRTAGSGPVLCHSKHTPRRYRAHPAGAARAQIRAGWVH